MPTYKHCPGTGSCAVVLRLVLFLSKFLEPPAELGLEAAAGRLVEAAAPQLLGQQRLVADPLRLVLGVAVALTAAERGSAGIVGVAQVVGGRLRAVGADLGAGGGEALVGGV